MGGCNHHVDFSELLVDAPGLGIPIVVNYNMFGLILAYHFCHWGMQIIVCILFEASHYGVFN